MSRGSTTPSLFAADDAREWVVKPSGRTFRDGLVELLSSRLAAVLAVPTPAVGVFPVSPGLLAAMAAMAEVDADLHRLAEAFERGGRLAFGSLLSPGADWVPPACPASGERVALGRLWVFDRWIANADRRPDNPNLILSGPRLLAIDHAQGLPWLLGDAPRPSPHVRTAFEGDPEVVAGEREARTDLRPWSDERAVRRAFGEVPAAWAHAEELDALAEILARRAVALVRGEEDLS